MWKVLRTSHKKISVLQNDKIINKTGEKVKNPNPKKCWYSNPGFCTYKSKCRLFNQEEVCKEYLRSGNVLTDIQKRASGMMGAKEQFKVTFFMLLL